MRGATQHTNEQTAFPTEAGQLTCVNPAAIATILLRSLDFRCREVLVANHLPDVAKRTKVVQTDGCGRRRTFFTSLHCSTGAVESLFIILYLFEEWRMHP